MNRILLPLVILSLVCGCAMQGGGLAEIRPAEGMWLPDAPPMDRLKQQFDFTPTQAWLDHLRLSSVNIGASGAFISSDGLVLTNHHVAVDGLQSISRPGKDYVADGFLARTRDQEIPLPGMDLSVPVSIEDVTKRVEAGVDAKLPADQAVKARHAVIAHIESESKDRTGLQSNVVTLYGGAMYHLYRYKRYNDVRLVFAPEVSTAFFGGDPDNFEYPRFDLDIALLRAYENGRPAHVDNYLHLSKSGVADGDLVFVSGHPGRTDRLLTTAALITMRDVTLPVRIASLESHERAILDYSKRSDEARRQGQEELFFVQNSLKATRPRLTALRAGVIEQKQREENAFRAQLRRHPDLRSFDVAWDRIAAAERVRTQLHLSHMMLEERRAFSTGLFDYARDLVRMSAEDAKPDAQRLPEFTQSRRQELEDRLYADNPIYPEFEIATLTASLTFFREKMGPNSDLVRQVLAGKEPAARAAELVHGSKLASAEERKRLAHAGANAIASSSDTMIQLVRSIDDEARKLRLDMESQVIEPENQAMTQINRARFELFGRNVYPDATGTLRLAFGVVKGYEQEGQAIAPWTTMGGAFVHERENGAVYPFKLPASWTATRDRIEPATPLNFVCTADITGGNSGSPIVNRAGELVGVIFDSNRQGVADNLGYNDVQSRAVAVDVRAIRESLAKIYSATELLAELGG